MRLTARDYDNIAEEQEAMIQQEIKKEFIMQAKELTESHIGGVFKMLDGIIVLLDWVPGEKAVLLYTDKGSICVDPETELTAVA